MVQGEPGDEFFIILEVSRKKNPVAVIFVQQFSNCGSVAYQWVRTQFLVVVSVTDKAD